MGGHSRSKFKHLLWLADLKASSLINCPEKLIYETPSNTKILELCKYTIVSYFFYIEIILLDELCIT